MHLSLVNYFLNDWKNQIFLGVHTSRSPSPYLRTTKRYFNRISMILTHFWRFWPKCRVILAFVWKLDFGTVLASSFSISQISHLIQNSLVFSNWGKFWLSFWLVLEGKAGKPFWLLLKFRVVLARTEGMSYRKSLIFLLVCRKRIWISIALPHFWEVLTQL